MFSKFFTVVVIPQKTSKVSKFKIPVRLFGLVAVILMGILGAWGWVLQDYFSLKTRLIDLSDAYSQHSKQQGQIDEYTQQIGSIQLHLDRLKELNYKLRVLTSLEVPRASKGTKKPAEEKRKISLEKVASTQSVLEVIASDQSEIKTSFDEREEKFENLVNLFEDKQNYYSRIPNRWPVKGFLTSSFGFRSDPYSGELRPHFAIDIATRPLSPIYAPADGIVILAEVDELLGNLMKIDHGIGLTTWYGHLSSFDVNEGDRVKRNEIIGRIGSTGRSTGPHLHYEVRFNGVPQNPVKFIRE